MQAASGQWEVMRKRQPIAEVIADPATPEELVARLELVDEARDFSIRELGLPDNSSYRSYADLERDFIVWNVTAAPEFSLQAKVWCFPVVGCVSYRGYFSERDAIRASERLSKDGFDVAVGGVVAYSTLGKFSDPILNTMMHWSDLRLVAVLFHELAHQRLYVKDDSRFNESFATAVEEIGLQRWLESHANAAEFDQYREHRNFEEQITRTVNAARDDLQRIYALDIGLPEMRELKRARLTELSEALRAVAIEAGRSVSAYPDTELNNAHLVLTGLYEGLLPQFRALYRACDESLARFYKAAEYLADLDKSERDRRLATGDLRCVVDGPDH
ncbi:MAG TPA: aminopeptidase [Woeseiaceae bacterium]|nr:aminopeptidase [Woeseiaceae bacterium]